MISKYSQQDSQYDNLIDKIRAQDNKIAELLKENKRLHQLISAFNYLEDMKDED